MTQIYDELLKDLGLQQYYPEKIQLQDVIRYSLTTSRNTSLTIQDVPWRLLGQILMVNTDARDRYIQQLLESCDENSSDFLDETIQSLHDILDQNQFEPSVGFHPLDIFLTSFLCCNSLLKQTLISKIVICRLAVPFIYRTDDKEFQCLHWALRSTVTERVCYEKSRSEDLIITQPNRIITFIRCGESSVSKSNILNNVLSNNAHRTFFHRNCPMGSSKFTVYKGTIEASWFFPSDFEGDAFNETLMFLNLRGDALEESCQTDMILDISNVIVVTLTAEWLKNEKTVEIVVRAHENKIPVIFGVDASNHSQRDVVEMISTYTMNEQIESSLFKIVLTKIKGTEKCLSDTVIIFRRKITEFLSLSSKGKSISECCSLFKQIQTDEVGVHFTVAKEKAITILKMLNRHSKKELLPLQGELWRSWANQYKQYFRSENGQNIAGKDQLEGALRSLRNKQCQTLNHLSPFISTIVKLITELYERDEPDQLDIFLRYLQLGLDRYSKQVLPSCSKEYHKKWNDWKVAIDKKMKPEQIAILRKLADESEVNLSEAGFGIEHVFREIGQMYESYKECPKIQVSLEIKRLVSKLPKVVASLLSKGYPFELLDGDAACIPAIWVKTVLFELQAIIGDKKLLTLSVLGIQSSGKSTLLNTMFGMEFPVKAGRCTRGVFMRLLPVPDKTFPFDYIFVIDTEGLRAPELAFLKYDHDNELATFVLGLGDITLINIKGENTNEVQDILQIAVHAFMKLMLVNEKIKLKQSCIFVHQNVSATDAKDKLAYATKKTVETLDKMTLEAAEQLNIADVYSFKQIIYFDTQKHVWYFPDLWQGDPPMAPPNPGYSKMCYDLRSAILDEAIERKSYLNVSDTTQRLGDLWKGIITEDFVFSFRNTLEIKAYHMMESKVQDLSSEMKKAVFNFALTKLKAQLSSCETEATLNCTFQTCVDTLRQFVEDEFGKLKKSMISFFDQNPHKDLTIKWRESTVFKFDSMKNDYFGEAKIEIERQKENNRLRLLNITQLAADEQEISKRAKQLATQLKGKQPSDDKLHEMFSQMWNEWIKRYQPTTETKDTPLHWKIESVLRERLTKYSSFVNEMKQKSNIFDYKGIKTLHGSLKLSHITEQHISINKKFFQLFKKANFDNCAKNTLDLTNGIFTCLDSQIDSYVKREDGFNIMYIEEPLDMLVRKLEEFNTTNKVFQLLPTYISMLAVHLCTFARIRYEEMNQRYEKKHGRRAIMEEYRKSVWEIFYNSTQEKTSEYIASSILKNVVVENTIKHVEEMMKGDIIQYLKSQVGSSKHALITLILDGLADDNDFKGIRNYTLNGRQYSAAWFTKFSEKALFTSSNSSDSQFCKFASFHIMKIKQCLITAVGSANSKMTVNDTNTSQWIKYFTEGLIDSLPLSKLEFRNVESECPTVKGSFNDFSELVLNQLETMEHDAVLPFRKKNQNNISWPHGNPIDEMFETLWGCEEHCPFCKEPCQFTEKNHEANRSHSCLQHRPAAIIGTYNSGTEKLVLEVCSSYVADKRSTFYCSASHLECRKHGKCTANDEKTYHHYHEYKNFIPTWDIPPDSTLRCSNYWAWVINTFQNEINECSVIGTLPEIPTTWKTITKQDAKDSLRG